MTSAASMYSNSWSKERVKKSGGVSFQAGRHGNALE